MRDMVLLSELTPRMQAWVHRYYTRWSGSPDSRPAQITIQGLAGFIKEVLKVPNLFPDQSRTTYTGSEDFIFAAPVDEHDWKRMLEMASFSMNTTKTPFVNLPKETFNDDCGVTLLLRRADESDDDMLEAAAWLRMAKNNTDRIYAIGSYRELSMYDRLMKTTGLSAAHRKLSIMFDLPKEKKPPKK